MPNLGGDFYNKLVQITSEVGMKPEDLLATMVSESGINPAAHNPGGASGLIQFMPSTLKNVGYQGTPAEFRQTSGSEQLDYVKRYIEDKMKFNGGPFKSAAQYYVANFWPVALKLPGVQNQDPDTKIVESHPMANAAGNSQKYANLGFKVPADYESTAYRGNAGLFDKGHKGYITYGDMIQQVEQNKRNPIYQQAIAAMQSSTGYNTPKQTKPSMVATKPSSATTEENSPSLWTRIEQLLSHYLSMFSIANDNVSLKRLYKTALPTHYILIKVAAPDYTSAIEFARILSNALDEETLSTSYPHSDGNLVEIECSIQGPAKECFAAVKQMSEVIAETFQEATQKIGGIPIKVECLMNNKSSYQPISLRTASTNYRKFLLKFISKE
jgi:hypothetical protein